MITVALLGWAAAVSPCFGQDTSAPSSTAVPWTADQLDQMVGPVALYPDPLIGLILPAATVPSQIVMADRYISQGGDTNLIAQQPWAPAVQGLAHYPDVLKWMDDNIAWTTQLGEAFASQQNDVMDAVQRLRGKAQALGNLPSTPQETVQDDNGDIDIEPTDPDEIYVPDYEPGVIYEQPGIYCTFGLGFPIGLWLGFDWNWHHHHLIHWGADYPRPAGWWSHPASWRRGQIGRIRDSNMWRPQPVRAGRVLVSGGDRGYVSRDFYRAMPNVPAPRVRTTESRTVTVNRTVEVSRPEERAPAVRESSESAFGGEQSSREIRASSFRGAESRSSVSFGGGGGGGHSGGRH